LIDDPAVESPPGEKAYLYFECKFAFMSAKGPCRNRKEAVNIVMPVKTGIQNMLKILDSPVPSTRQAQSRASLALNDKKVITTQFLKAGCFFDLTAEK
jgi:hypothetical protein